MDARRRREQIVAEHWVKALIALTVCFFLALCYLWKKPITDFGKVSLRICVVNAVGWFIILPFDDRGHPPSFLFPTLLFWLLNLILLPAIAVVLWMCRRDREERKSYLAIASTYLALNVILLYIFPIVGLLLEETRR
jgi:hypothetical protein